MEELSSDPTIGKGEDVTKRFKYISHYVRPLVEKMEKRISFCSQRNPQ